MIDLCVQRTFVALTADPSWDDTPLGEDDLADLGPAIQDIVAHCQGANFTSHFEYKVLLQRRFVDGPWEDATTDLVATRSTTGYAVGSTFSNRQEIGLENRVVVRTRIKTGGSGAQRGNLSLTLAVRTFCC